MSVLVALTVGLVFWIAAWSFGVKSFDAFMVTAALVVVAVAARMITPFIRQLLGRDVAGPAEQGVERAGL
jgi:hypothetical protein